MTMVAFLDLAAVPRGTPCSIGGTHALLPVACEAVRHISKQARHLPALYLLHV
jgi:hypothetical protein